MTHNVPALTQVGFLLLCPPGAEPSKDADFSFDHKEGLCTECVSQNAQAGEVNCPANLLKLNCA